MEGIKDILDSISAHTAAERQHYIRNKSIARGQVTTKEGENMTVWIVNRQYSTGDDWLNVPQGEYTTSKNSRWGQILTDHYQGDYYCMGHDRYRPRIAKRIDFTINNSSSYFNTPTLEQLKVGVSGENGWRYFRTINEAYNAIRAGLEKLQEIQRKEEAAKKALEEAAKRAKEEAEAAAALEEQRKQEEELAQLEEKKKKVQKELIDLEEKYRNACSFVRQQASLRLNPLIDSVQNSVKFSHVYDGTCVVIEGGPGTGKTTTLIQRLKYFISIIDLEDNMLNDAKIKISNEQFDVIMQDGGDWLFFSPTELLRMYLRDAMNEEGLKDTENRTAVWTKYLRKVLRDYYHLIGNDCPFGGSSETIPMYLGNEREIIRDVNRYMVDQIVSDIRKMIAIDSSKYSWRYIADSVRKSAEKIDSVNDFSSLVRMLISFNSVRRTTLNGFNEVDTLMGRYRGMISELSAALMVRIQEDNELYASLRALINKNLQVAIEEDEDDEEEEIDSFAEDKLKIASRLRAMLKAAAVNLLDPNFKLSGLNKEYHDRIKHLIKEDDLRSIGELALFDKRIRPLIEHPDRFIFNRIPRLYKAYRKGIASSRAQGWNIELLESEVSAEKRNRPLHPQEQALLLGIINNISLRFYKANSRVFGDLKHKYIDAYKTVIKPVIGVDEATDYSVMDFYAISSLRHYLVSSVTLAGDVMQGLTVNGIKDWTDLYDEDIFPEMDITPLKTSYRQSPALLGLAQRLYKKQIGFPAPYKSYLEGSSEPVPKPLWFESNDDLRKAEWLIDRILEVKAKYTFVPSIAIFVDDSQAAAKLTEELLSFETLQDEGIDVADCSRGDTLSSRDTVRIFPIALVKGMEFEVAFFHNIDSLQSELVERYLYVGLSRAAFFLGVTSSSNNSLLNSVRDLFSDGNWRQI